MHSSEEAPIFSSHGQIPFPLRYATGLLTPFQISPLFSRILCIFLQEKVRLLLTFVDFAFHSFLKIVSKFLKKNIRKLENNINSRRFVEGGWTGERGCRGTHAAETRGGEDLGGPNMAEAILI